MCIYMYVYIVCRHKCIKFNYSHCAIIHCIHVYVRIIYYTFDTNIPLSFGSRGFPIVDLVPPLMLTPNLADADFLITMTYMYIVQV